MKKPPTLDLIKLARIDRDLIYYLPLLTLILIVLLFGHPAYSANDDFAMMSIASGAIDGIPDAHLIFTNSLIGEALKNLYALAADVNWYTAYLLAIVIISQFFLLRAILKVTQNRTIKLIGLSAVLIFTSSFLILFNFTTVAILASFAGLSTLMVEWMATSRGWGFKVAGILLVFLGGLIRIQALLYIAVLVAPILILLGRERLKRMLPWLACLVILVGAATVYDSASYASNSEWESFKTYNQQRGQIHSTAKMAFGDNDAFLASIGWSKTAFSLFDNWIFIDDQVFTLKSLQAINSTYSASIHTPAEIVATFASLIKSRWLEVVMSLGAIGLSVYTSLGNRKRLLIAIGIPLYIMVINILVAIILRMVDNIFYPSLLILVTLEIGFTGWNAIKTDSSRKLTSLLTIALVGFLLIKIFDLASIARQSITNENEVSSIIKQVHDIVGPRGTALVVLQASSFPDIWISTYSSSGIPFDYLPTGWLINSPPYRHILHRYGIGNPIDAIGTRNDVYYLGDNQEEFIAYLDQMKNIKVNALELGQFVINYKGHDQIYLTMFQGEQ